MDHIGIVPVACDAFGRPGQTQHFVYYRSAGSRPLEA